MCESACGMKVFLKDGKIVDIWGDDDHPRTHGSLCLKGSAQIQHAYNPIRVKYPMIREDNINGQFRRVTWDEALDFVADKLKKIADKWGPEAVACHRTGRSSFGNKQGAARFLRLYGTPNVYGQGPICCESPGVANHYVFGSRDLARLMNPCMDWVNSKVIIAAGSNMAANEVLTCRWLIEARDRNQAKIIVVDPRMTATASIADLYLQVRPGTDAALVLAMIHVIIKKELYDKEFVKNWVKDGDMDRLRKHVQYMTPEWAEEITWVPAELIERAALWFGTLRPASMTGNLGTAQVYNSNNMNRAYAILQSLTGCIGVPGGGWNWLHNCRPPLNAGVDLKDAPPLRKPQITDKLVPWADSSSPCLIDPMITGKPYPIKAIIWNGNHIVQWPNNNKTRKAMRNMELAVHLAFHPNETGKYAHAVFPIGSMMEREGICHHGNDRSFAWHNKIIPFQWECRSDLDFWAGLAVRFGWGDWFPWFDENGLINERKSTDFWISQEPMTAGITSELIDPETSPVGGIAWPAETREKASTFEEGATMRGTWIMYREGENYPGSTKRFPTPSGKIEFYSEVLADLGWDPIPVHRDPSETPYTRPDLYKKYPFILCTGRLVSHFHEMGHWWPWTTETEPHAFVNIHPDTAKELGIRDGDITVLENDRGRVEYVAWVTEMTHPKVVWAPADFDREQPFFPYENINNLIDDIIKDPVYGQVQYKATLCNVYKKEA